MRSENNSAWNPFLRIEADIATLYGEKFREPLKVKPVSGFIVDGSYVEVQLRTARAGARFAIRRAIGF